MDDEESIRTFVDRVLYPTGYSDRIFTDRSSLREHEAFLEKPYTVKSLLQAVSLMMSGHI